MKDCLESSCKVATFSLFSNHTQTCLTPEPQRCGQAFHLYTETEQSGGQNKVSFWVQQSSLTKTELANLSA